MDIKEFKAGSYGKGYEYRHFLPEKINYSLLCRPVFDLSENCLLSTE